MKTLLKLSFAALLLVSTSSYAQTFKFGHINMQTLVQLMPETDSANVALEKYGKDLEETFQGMQKEFQSKYETYQQKQKDWLPAVIEAKEKELGEIQQRLQQFQQTAQQDISQMQARLLQPVIKKANDAVEKIAKTNGFTYIFDTSIHSMIYINNAQSQDILPLAKQALGIPASKTLPAANAQ